MYVMCSCIIKLLFFVGDKVIGVILFEMIMDCDIDGILMVEYFWI